MNTEIHADCTGKAGYSYSLMPVYSVNLGINLHFNLIELILSKVHIINITIILEKWQIRS